jgi:hypothetical protein
MHSLFDQENFSIHHFDAHLYMKRKTATLGNRSTGEKCEKPTFLFKRKDET